MIGRQPPVVRIVDLEPDDEPKHRAVARLLVESFTHIPGCFTKLEDGLAEVRASLEPGRISRVALDDAGSPVGWIGGIEQYHGHAVELHPLAVSPRRRREGIGRALVADLEEQARRRGAVVVYLGADDEFGGTSLFGADLFPNVLEQAGAIRNLAGHPFEFYQKCGYAVVGVLPDANGPGRPDILMARRIAGNRP